MIPFYLLSILQTKHTCNSSTIDVAIPKRGSLIPGSSYSWRLPFDMGLIISWWSFKQVGRFTMQGCWVAHDDVDHKQPILKRL